MHLLALPLKPLRELQKGQARIGRQTLQSVSQLFSTNKDEPQEALGGPNEPQEALGGPNEPP